MSRRLVMTNTHKQHKIAKASAIASHKRYHLAAARDIRSRADQIEKQLNTYIANVETPNNFVEESTIDYMRQEVINLRAMAIAEENNKCMDKH